jgi:hypothetical protein
MDFFGAIKSRLADAAVRDWLQAQGVDSALSSLLASHGAGSGAGGAGAAAAAAPAASLQSVLAAGRQLVEEQQSVLDVQLAKEYMPGVDDGPDALAAREARGLRRRRRPRAPRRVVEAEASQAASDGAVGRAALSEEMASYWQKMAASSWVSGSFDPSEVMRSASDGENGDYGEAPSAASSQSEAEGSEAEDEPAAAGSSGSSGAWPPALSPDAVAAAISSGSAMVLDVRSARDHEWGKVKGSIHAPFVLSKGTALNPTVDRNPGFLAAVAAKVKDPSRPVILYGPGRANLDENAVYVSKEMFVSLAPAGAAAGDEVGAVRTLVCFVRVMWGVLGVAGLQSVGYHLDSMVPPS